MASRCFSDRRRVSEHVLTRKPGEIRAGWRRRGRRGGSRRSRGASWSGHLVAQAHLPSAPGSALGRPLPLRSPGASAWPGPGQPFPPAGSPQLNVPAPRSLALAVPRELRGLKHCLSRLLNPRASFKPTNLLSEEKSCIVCSPSPDRGMLVGETLAHSG